MTPELASGETNAYAEADCASLLAPLQRDVSLARLDAVVDAALQEHPPGEASVDPDIAIDVHRALPLTRREAADPGVFRYLAVIRHPAVVRHRWEYRSFATMRDRFWRPGARHDSNAFSRWWWIAELSRDGEDYALTRRILRRSVFATHLFTRDLAGYRPALVAITDVLADQAGPLVEASLRNLGKMLSVRVLESLTDEELHAVLVRALELAKG